VIEFRKKKKMKSVSTEDMNLFLDSLISLVTKFKAKVSAME